MSNDVEAVRLSVVTTAVQDEYGSLLCAWTDMGTKRCCTINVPPHFPCRCQAVAQAAIAALNVPALEARIKELEGALNPFNPEDDDIDGLKFKLAVSGPGGTAHCDITDAIRRARSALGDQHE